MRHSPLSTTTSRVQGQAETPLSAVSTTLGDSNLWAHNEWALLNLEAEIAETEFRAEARQDENSRQSKKTRVLGGTPHS